MLMLLVQCKTVAFITSIFLSDIVVEADHVSSKLEVRMNSIHANRYNLIMGVAMCTRHIACAPSIENEFSKMSFIQIM